MRGYYTSNYYMGYLPSIGRYFKFDTEGEYEEYYRENEES